MRLLAAVLLVGCGASAPVDASHSAPTWMVGAWRSIDEGRVTEELWVEDGDRLLGLNRTLDASGEVTHHEVLRLDADGYHAAPTGQAVTRFATARSGPSRARFENPQHDFPRWIEYARVGPQLRARIGGEGETAAAEWRFAIAERPTPTTRRESARVCRDDRGLHVTLSGCRCSPTLYCAELAGELVVAVVSDACAECEEVRGTCHADARVIEEPRCEERSLSVVSVAR